MRSYSLSAAAKINLYLEIIGDRPDGYHELAMVMQSVGLTDQIYLRPIDAYQIRVVCDHPHVPTDSHNLAYRAAELMYQTFPEAFKPIHGVEITIDKRIPIGAGLAGGSSNAAAVLVGLDLMAQVGLTQIELQELGAQLGSDVPFCISGGTAIATGRGEKLAPLPSLEGAFVVLAKYSTLSISTPWAYQTYRQEFESSYVSHEEGVSDRQHKVHAGPMVSAISHQDYAQIGKLLHNDLEKVVLPHYASVATLRQTLADLAPWGAMMSGSGPTVFALVETAEQAQEVAQTLGDRIADPALEIWTAPLVPSSIQLTPP